MTKKPETVKEEDLIQRKDGLYYKKYAKVPFTGKAEQFHSNGKLKRKETYKKGKLRGPCEVFHENGQIKFEGTYKYRDSVLDGEFTSYHKNGHVHQRAYLWKGIIDGGMRETDEEGNEIKYREYNMGTFRGYYDEEEEVIEVPSWIKNGPGEAEGYYDEDEETLIAYPPITKIERKVLTLINDQET